MQDKVKSVLTTNTHCRNSDVYLDYEKWIQENMDKPKLIDDQSQINQIHMIDMFRMWKDKLISHPSAIMRARRKVQEEHPHTRGKVWKERHKQQEQVKQYLVYNSYSGKV